jgi:hypothetical protein
MKTIQCLAGVSVAAALLGCAARLPLLKVPDGLGVNIHFTGAPARDLDMIQAAGFRFIRMDFTWERVEKTKGVYDFAPYDQLTDALEKRGIRPLYILDYSNKLYETDRSVRTEEGRKAFARFASAAAKRYRGRGILWELWNEPNIGFWKPKPDVNDYMALAKAVFPAVKQADPQAVRVAPATSGVPLGYLESCFKQDLLNMVEAVTVHPYRQQPPETAAADYLKLRALIARYCPARPDLPILSGEWGYSAVWKDFDEQRQGQYLPRQFLTNLSLGVPVSIWYDWHDDGKDPKNAEHHFGTVTTDYKPKPAYLAMQRLVKALDGMCFVKRVQAAPDDYLLLFSNGERHVLAAWTTADAHEVEPFGKTSPIRLTGDPQYIPVPPEGRGILAEGAWTVVTRSPGVRGGAQAGKPFSPHHEVVVRNPFPHPISVNLKATPEEGVKGGFVGPERFRLEPGQEQRVEWKGQVTRRDLSEAALSIEAEVGGFRSEQRAVAHIMNPITLSAALQRDKQLVAIVRDPAGEGFRGEILVQVGASSASFLVKVDPSSQEVICQAASPVGGGAVQNTIIGDAVYLGLPVEVGSPQEEVRISLIEGETVAKSGAIRVLPLKVRMETARAVGDGDAKVPAKFELTDVEYGADASAPADRGLRLTYDYGKGWKFVRIAPPKGLPVDGKPRAIGVWVKGDGSGCGLNLRFADQNKRTFQSGFGRMDFKGWRFLTAEMNNPKVGHWGGEGDPNQIAYPVCIDTFILVDGKKEPVKGEVEFACFQLLYTD